MKAKQVIHNRGTIAHSTIVNAENYSQTVNVKLARRARKETYYPPGCIGADLARRNYIHYLVERYHRFRRADTSFGQKRPFSYAVLYKNIEQRFDVPAYFVPVGHFDELVDYLHRRINDTILGRNNRSKGIPSYRTFDDFLLEQDMAVDESAVPA